MNCSSVVVHNYILMGGKMPELICMYKVHISHLMLYCRELQRNKIYTKQHPTQHHQNNNAKKTTLKYIGKQQIDCIV